jgi:hypothetical protein
MKTAAAHTGAVTAILFVGVSLMFLSSSGLASSKTPSSSPEERILASQTWTELYLAFQTFKALDDGIIAEAFSDSVASLLAGKWSSLPELHRLSQSDPGFRAFVLRHIDATINNEKAKSIEELALSRCPTRKQFQLCGAILDAVRSSRKR